MSVGPGDTYPILAPITGATQTCVIPLGLGQAVCGITIAGTWAATLVFEAATDPANVPDASATWIGVSALAAPNLQNASGTTVNGNWTFVCGGYSRFRVRCSAFTSGSVVVGLAASCATAPGSYVAVNTLPNQTLMAGLSPSAASTVAQSALLGLDSYRECTIYAVIQGATGGPLDIFVQSSFDSGLTWVDVIHYTQLAAAGAQVGWFATLTRGDANAAAPTAVNITSNSPLLAANKIIADGLGNALRVICVAGALTTLGATQTIKAFMSSQ